MSDGDNPTTATGNRSHSVRSPFRLAATAALLLTLIGCGGTSDESLPPNGPDPAASTTAPILPQPSATTPTIVDASSAPTTDTEAPMARVEDGSVPFVICNNDDSEVGVLSSDNWSPSTLATGVAGLCNILGGLTNTHVSADGRYVVAFWDDDIEIIDLSDGSHQTIDEADRSNWAARHEESGLNATELSIGVSGFSREGSGTVYFRVSGGPSPVDEAAGVSYYSQSLEGLVFRGLEPRLLNDYRFCYLSSNWSPQGSSCYWAGRLFPADLPGSSDVPEGYLSCPAGDVLWVDESTIIAMSFEYSKGQVLNRFTVGGSCEPYFSLSGDRELLLFGISGGDPLIASEELNSDSTEIYLVKPGGETVLLYQFDAETQPNPILGSTYGGA